METSMLAARIEDFLRTASLTLLLERLRRALGPGATVFLVGGAIRDLAIAAMYGRHVPVKDIDLFIDGVESLAVLQRRLARDRLEILELGGLRWRPLQSSYPFDLCLVKDFVVLKKYGLEPTLENLLATLDFTINAIAYDLATGRLFERNAISDIEKRLLEFNTRMFYTRTAVAYRVLLLQHKTGFRLSPAVFDYMRSEVDIETLSSVKRILTARWGKVRSRTVLKEYDRICSFHDYEAYRRQS